jgi:hypothetical protein
MHPAAGIAVIAVSGVVAIIVGGPLRRALPRPAVDALMALAGAGLGIGGLLTLDDVGSASWIAAPFALAIVGPLHVRALFAGDGPFRT